MRYRARRLPEHRGPAAWNVILGPQAAATPLEHDTTADVTIIGGGFAGLSAARRLVLQDPKLRVVLLEAGRIAEGAAGRNSGFMIDLPHELTSQDYAGPGDDRAVIALNRQAIVFAAQAVEDYGIDVNFFDPAGKVNGAASEHANAQNLSYARHLEQLGEHCEMLDARQMHALTGSSHYMSGLYTPGTVMLQPAGYVRGLAAGLAQRVAIHENSPVTGFTSQGTGWCVHTPGGDVSTGQIILANNGHLESFGIASGRLMQLFLFASMTPELDRDVLVGAPRWGVTPSDPMGTTLRRIDTGQGGNRIITRTCATLRAGMVPGPGDVARAARVQQRKFDKRFPALAGTVMEHAWAGHLCLSLNGVSVVQEVAKGVFTACVQNGLGTARGTLTGIAAADLVCGAPSDISKHFSAEDPPRTLPPLAQIAGNAVLRWKEWRARED